MWKRVRQLAGDGTTQDICADLRIVLQESWRYSWWPCSWLCVPDRDSHREDMGEVPLVRTLAMLSWGRLLGWTREGSRDETAWAACRLQTACSQTPRCVWKNNVSLSILHGKFIKCTICWVLINVDIDGATTSQLRWRLPGSPRKYLLSFLVHYFCHFYDMDSYRLDFPLIGLHINGIIKHASRFANCQFSCRLI